VSRERKGLRCKIGICARVDREETTCAFITFEGLDGCVLSSKTTTRIYLKPSTYNDKTQYVKRDSGRSKQRSR
jgi:hypothetical protein